MPASWSVRMPSASSTSAEPDARGDRAVAVLRDRNAGRRDDERRGRRDVERPAPVAAGAARIDRRPRARRPGRPRSRIAVANPASSSTVSPRIRSATSRAASWAGVASPSITAPIAPRASSSDRSRRRRPRPARRARARSSHDSRGRRGRLPGPPRRVAADRRAGVLGQAARRERASCARSGAASPSPARRRKLASRCGPSRRQHGFGVELDALQRQARRGGCP